MRFWHQLDLDGISCELHIDATPADPRDLHPCETVELIGYRALLHVDLLLPLTFESDELRIRHDAIEAALERWLEDHREIVTAEIERRRDQWEAEREDADEVARYYAKGQEKGPPAPSS